MSHDLEYRVIRKRDIPTQNPQHNKRYGQWLALARTIKILAPNEAVELDLTAELYASKAITSLHTAADAIGVKVTTSAIGTRLYVVRCGSKEPAPRWGMTKKTFICKYCQDTVETSREWQEVCRKKECQRKRQREAQRRYDRKKAQERKAAA